MSSKYITLLRTGLIMLLGTAVIACATFGRDFDRPHPKTLELGTTNYQQIIQRLGEPQTKGQSSYNGKVVESITYTFSDGAAKSSDNIIPTRTMVFHFFENLLVGYAFVSSFPQDKTDFDESKVNAITKDQSTVDQVVALLGEPSGKMSWPVVKNNEERAVMYLYAQVREVSLGKINAHSKVLTVTHNKRGLVTNVEFVMQGEK
jgi:hypothetical protein